MNSDFDSLEDFWGEILSRNKELIRAAIDRLDVIDQEVVLVHLNRMVDEPGWQDEQRISAQVALEALDTNSKQV